MFRFLALSSKEKSPEIQSQSQSRASSVACASNSNQSVMPNNVQDSGLVPVQAMDSVTTVKHSLIVVNSPSPANSTPPAQQVNSNKKTLKKPKKQAGWLVDLSNNEPTSKVRLKSKPPTGKNNNSATGLGGPLAAESVEQEVSNVTEQEIDSSEEPSSIQDEILNLEEDEMNTATPEVEIEQKPVKSNEISQQQQREVMTTTTTSSPTPTPPPSPSTTASTSPPSINNKVVQQDLCFNYASILKFVKRGK